MSFGFQLQLCFFWGGLLCPGGPQPTPGRRQWKSALSLTAGGDAHTVNTGIKWNLQRVLFLFAFLTITTPQFASRGSSSKNKNSNTAKCPEATKSNTHKSSAAPPPPAAAAPPRAPAATTDSTATH